MSMFYRRGTSVRGYIKSNGVVVSKHYRDGSYVSFEDHCRSIFSNISSFKPSNLFRTHCFDCGEEVWFVRNAEYGGCFTADELGPNWVVHPCWETHKHNSQKRMNQIITYLQQEKDRLKGLSEGIPRVIANREVTKRILKMQQEQKEVAGRIEKLPTLKLNDILNTGCLGERAITVSNVISKMIAPKHAPEPITYVVWAYTGDNKFELAVSKEKYSFNNIKLCKTSESNLNFLERSKGGIFYLDADNPSIIDTVEFPWVVTKLSQP